MESTKIRGQAGHVAGKLRRRRAIVEAARAIITESGDAELTMRAVAARAGVSLVTPYNLFGSKQAILLEVYEEDLENFHAMFEQEASEDHLLKLFDLIDVNFRYWENDIGFYKSISSILYSNSGPDVTAAVWSSRVEYVRQLVERAVEGECLVASTPTSAVTQTLMRIFNAAIREWIDNVLTLAEVREQIGIGFVLVLSSLVTERSMADLASIRARYGLGG